MSKLVDKLLTRFTEMDGEDFVAMVAGALLVVLLVCGMVLAVGGTLLGVLHIIGKLTGGD